MAAAAVVLEVGSEVELLVDIHINGGTWCCGQVVDSHDDGCCTIATVNGFKTVSIKLLRPSPPKVITNFTSNDLVECFHVESISWKPATIVTEFEEDSFVVQLCGSLCTTITMHKSLLRPQHFWLGDRWLLLSKSSPTRDDDDWVEEVDHPCQRKRKSPDDDDEFNYDFDLSSQGTTHPSSPPLSDSDYNNSCSSYAQQHINMMEQGAKRLRYCLEEEFSDAESSVGSCSIHAEKNTASSIHIFRDDSDAESSYCFSPHSTYDEDKIQPLEFYCWL